MPDPNFVILYVKSAPASASFYAGLLGKPPVESSPNFALFALESGTMLGLWSRGEVSPALPDGARGGGELAIAVEGKAAVESTHEDWQRRGLPIAQAPTDLDFGRSFVALDPDGYRLRVFAPAAP